MIDDALVITPLSKPDPRRMKFAPRPAIYAAFLVIACDQLLKYSLTERIGPGASSHRINIAGESVGLTYTENRGFAFGLMDDRPVVAVTLALAGAAILAGMIWHWWSVLTPLALIGVALIAGGAASNMVDRIRQGYVVDFIDIGVWPNFNLADAALTVGLALLMFSARRSEADATVSNNVQAPR